MKETTNLKLPQELIILGAAVETGLFKQLEAKPLNAIKLAEKMEADRRAVWTLAEALLALGYLECSETGKYSLSNKTLKMMYEPDAPEFMGFAFMHQYNLIKRWIQLPQVVKNGKPARRKPEPEESRYFMDAMRHNAKTTAAPIARLLLGKARTGTRLLDIGGGPLFHAREFAKQGAQVHVLDRPDICKLMKPEADKLGVRMIPGDFLGKLPEDPYDIVYLGNICHIIGEPDNRALFKKVHQVLERNGCIAIVDFIRGGNPEADIFAINMLVNTPAGGTWTFSQYSDWLGAAGFADIKLHLTDGRPLLTARKF
jgi:SAM-dependent methyltransferase